MIFTQENEYSAVLDACVLVPAALNDFLLRLAEEPAMYRPLWSEQILDEMAKALRNKLHRTQQEVAYRRAQMCKAFPEAMVHVPDDLLKALEFLPDKGDRHVLAAAIISHANTIVTQNIKHFPRACFDKFGVLCQTADDFLVHEYHLHPQLMVDKIDDQAAGISQNRAYVIGSLTPAARAFTKLVLEEFGV